MMKGLRWLLFLFVLVLPACFRPAGEAIEPTPSLDASPVLPSPLPDLPDETEESANLSVLPAETEDTSVAPVTEQAPSGDDSDDATLPPITVISPTRPAPTQPTQAGTTPTYITPGVPSSPLRNGSGTATPTGGAFTSTPSGMVTPTDVFEGTDTSCTYTVVSGDNLFRISQAHNVTLDEMMAANPQLVGDPPILQPGDLLNLPNCASQGNVDTAATAAPTDVSAPPGGQVYTVEAGDTLVIIADQFGVTIEAIVAANNLANPDRLDIGQQLIIPPPT